MTQQAPSAPEVALIRRLAEEGWSPADVEARTRFGRKTIATIAAKHGIVFTMQRSTAEVAQEIEALVTEARKWFVPVCAESTIARQYACPEPYGPETAFRVGSFERVPVARLRELVAQGAQA